MTEPRFRLLPAVAVALVVAAILVISAVRDDLGAGVAVAVAVLTVYVLSLVLPRRRG
ncbi:hypothetical protein [Jidongwangia harbinensis]|uniref:hypothetical protein n=1 Tax=Jidongwangia harbinensis TaxID=2878561 RepID=UPI001CDA25F6|nr:hypothetical protein [Jidongwangia harbinensis]MCA2215255.1 hypothetical protein [Jidongwangia harbinensis]